jgi:hypothetical protein
MNFLSKLFGAAETAPNAGTGEVTEAVLPQDVVATVQPYHRKKIRYMLDEKRAICQKIWNREMKQVNARGLRPVTKFVTQLRCLMLFSYLLSIQLL